MDEYIKDLGKTIPSMEGKHDKNKEYERLSIVYIIDGSEPSDDSGGGDNSGTSKVLVQVVNNQGAVVKINGTEVNRTTFNGVDNPSITINVPDLAVGEYNVTVEYIDDPNYNSSNASALFHVDKANIPDANVTVVPTNKFYWQCDYKNKWYRYRIN